MPHYENVLPKGWCLSTLGEVFTLQAGKNITAKDIKDAVTESHPYKCYGGNGVRGFVALYNREGDFPIIGRQGALCGNINIAKGKFYATEHAVVVESYCDVDLMWAYYILITLNLNQYATATAQPGLSVAVINDVCIPIPPRKEQERISKEIEHWFALIDQIEQGKSDLQTIIKQTKNKILDFAIHGKLVPQDPNDEPAIELLKRINPDFTPCDNGHSEKFPQDWEHILIGDYVETVTDFVASGSFASLRENVKYYNEPNYAILVRTKDFQNNFKQDLVYTDQHGYDFLAKSNLFGGELIFSNVGSIGKIFIVPELNQKMTLAPNAIMVRFHNDKQQKWFYYLFSSTTGQSLLDSITSATAIGKFNKTDFKKLPIPIPPLAEQQRIVQKIEELFSVLDNIQKALEV